MSLLLVQLASSQDSQKRSSLLSKRAGNKNAFQKPSTTTEAIYDVSEACLLYFAGNFALNLFGKHFPGRRIRRRWISARRERWRWISQLHYHVNWSAEESWTKRSSIQIKRRTVVSLEETSPEWKKPKVFRWEIRRSWLTLWFPFSDNVHSSLDHWPKPCLLAA